jgi:hypothetical protein
MSQPRLFSLTAILILISCVFSGARAQMQDRVELKTKLEALREQIAAKEKVFLAPSAQDLAAFEEFLRQPDTGMIRIMPSEKYDRNLFTRGGGAFYSFNRLTHDYTYGADILLTQGTLRAGLAGANFGFLVLLGDVPIEAVTVEHPGVRFLDTFKAPSAEPEAREQYRRAGTGFEAEGFAYRSSLPATVNRTYVVRSVNYDLSDLLIALRVTRQDSDGSLILAWKILERFPVPQLAR